MRVARLALEAVLFAVVVSVVLPVLSASAASGPFVDDDQSRFEPYIESVVDEGLIDACNTRGNKYCPDQAMTRSEYARTLFRATHPPISGQDRFDDDAGDPNEIAINALAGIGAIDECGTHRFCPDAPVRRGEAAVMLVAAMGWDPVKSHPYQDVGVGIVGRSLAAVGKQGAIEPCDPPVGHDMCPRRTMNRGEVARLVAEALGLETAKHRPVDEGNDALRFTDKFSDLDLWDNRVPSYRNRVRLTGDGFDGSGLKVTIPRGSHFGADFKLHLGEEVGEEPERLFFRYFLKLDPNWAPASSGKLPGFSGVYRSAGKGGFRSQPGSPGWSARVRFSASSENDSRSTLGYYVYHLDQPGRYGESVNWNEAGKLVPGEWYCLEGEIDLNTPGSADGTLRAWVDGTPAFETSGLQFRRSGEPGVRIESFWFNVYYGGPSVANQELGLTVDSVKVAGSRVGCGMGSQITADAEGDVTGNGYPDYVSWSDCGGVACLSLRATADDGSRVIKSAGAGVWTSLETHRTGHALGDFDGDGSDDVIYRGRCAGSVKCWRVHLFSGSVFDPGQDWGHAEALAPEADQVLASDLDGDGRDDLLYLGRCDEGPCWQAQLSDGQRLSKPRRWGDARAGVTPIAADLSGDGIEDVVYQGACGSSRCWFGQISSGARLGKPRRLGVADDTNLIGFVDFDGDGDADLLGTADDDQRLVIRRTKGDVLGHAKSISRTDRAIVEVAVRAAWHEMPASVFVTSLCGGGEVCTDHLLASGRRLLDLATYVERAGLGDRLKMADELTRAPLPKLVLDRYHSRLRSIDN